ncbi:TetR/AcrR family transcriptional regulator [Psychromicrobium lacuslunae]|uniref:TetR family transcriptional regulator n=1 Tax=Psychromicrobium lacuslunae TaxID=1618207 RepID=A0A0D4BZZ4_9MICC|nr:TetR/AcrR family transcriptional regulator [Psychromicrobium lacuslunae]AJT41903.1 TetR family transcriptional regulator [Psychromicrobium lacuslunae]
MTSEAGLRRGRPGYDQETVLRIAVDAFNQHGYEATSMGVLAENLGVSKSAIYHHVASKEELLELALEQALGGLEAVLSAPEQVPASLGSAASSTQSGSSVSSVSSAEQHQNSPEQRLEQVLRGTIAVLVDKLPYVTLLLRLRGNTPMERTALARRREFDREVAALVAAAQQNGSLRKDIDPRTAERLLFGTINSIVEWYRPGGSLTAEKLADDVIGMVFNGLRN